MENATADKTNKLYKTHPILDHLNERLQAMYRPDRELCIDESMLLFWGRVSFWQYNAMKRHRFGIKLFMLCSRSGYTQKVKIYAEKDPKRTASVAEAVVMELMDGFWCRNTASAPITGIPACHLPTISSRERRIWWEPSEEIVKA